MSRFLARRRSARTFALAEAAMVAEDFDAAASHASETLEILERARINNPEFVCRPMTVLFFCCRETGRLDEAKSWGARMLTAARDSRMMADGNTLTIAQWLASTEFEASNFAQSAEWSEYVFGHRLCTVGPQSERTGEAAFNVGIALYCAESYEKAATWLRMAMQSGYTAKLADKDSGLVVDAGVYYGLAMEKLGDSALLASIDVLLQTAEQRARDSQRASE